MLSRKLAPFRLYLIFLYSAVPGTAAPWPLGTLTLNGQSDPAVPAGYSSLGYVVSCPGVAQDARGFLAVAAHRGIPRGVIVFCTGGGGMGYWSDHLPEAHAMAEELRDMGFTIVQVRWGVNWLETIAGNEAGQAHLGCRPATVFKHIYETYYAPLGVLPSRIGEAGFCITGNSGGASQVGYALTHYGLDDILDVVIPTGGPPHSALAKSCMTNADERGYWFDLGTRQFIDRGFGFYMNGPAARQDAAFIPRWQEESHSTGGNDYVHPKTRVHFIIGGNDRGMQTIGGDYFQRLRSEGTPHLAWEIAPNTPHLVISTEIGRAALKNAILGVTLSQAAIRGGQFQFTVTGATNFNYVIQASTDLTNWLSLQTNRGPFTFIETNAASPPCGFYRALSRP
jgi:hypothetical protein